MSAFGPKRTSAVWRAQLCEGLSLGFRARVLAALQGLGAPKESEELEELEARSRTYRRCRLEPPEQRQRPEQQEQRQPPERQEELEPQAVDCAMSQAARTKDRVPLRR